MRYVVVLILSFAIVSCKKLEEKVQEDWQLYRTIQYDSIGTKTGEISYSKDCPYKMLTIVNGEWMQYDQNCASDQSNLITKAYILEEDSLRVYGNDFNGNTYNEWFIVNRINRREMDLELWKIQTTGSEWMVADKKLLWYRKSK